MKTLQETYSEISDDQKVLLREWNIKVGKKPDGTDKVINVSIFWLVFWSLILAGPWGTIAYLLYAYYNNEVIEEKKDGKNPEEAKEQVKARMIKKLETKLANVDRDPKIPPNKKSMVKGKLQLSINKVKSFN